MTFREVVYMILDQARLVTDDITLDEEHAIFLAAKARATLLAKKYKTVKTEVLDANYQVLCLRLEESVPISGAACEGETYLRSVEKVPNLLTIGNDLVTPLDYLQGIQISLIPIERMRFVGYNKFLKNITYAAVGHDDYLYLKSLNPLFRYLEQVKFTGIFDDVVGASALVCDKACELMDREFPLEDVLVTQMIEIIVRQLVGAAYHPKDSQNNANDDSDKLIAKQK